MALVADELVVSTSISARYRALIRIAQAIRGHRNPKELFQLTREIRAAGLELLGIYHSHPNGQNEPSPRDIEQAYYPDVAYFIVSPQQDAEKPLRAFSIINGQVSELEIQAV